MDHGANFSQFVDSMWMQGVIGKNIFNIWEAFNTPNTFVMRYLMWIVDITLQYKILNAS